MVAWLSKWGPLAGAVSFVIGSSTPDSSAPGSQVIQWYTTHHKRETVSDLLVGLAMFFLVLFAGRAGPSRPAQTLNMLENDFFLPVVLGFALFGILGGLTVVAGRILPRWMGWVLFAAGIVALVPPIAWFAMLAVGAQPQATPTQARRKPRSPTASVLSMNWSTAPVSGSRPTAGSVIASRSAAVKRPAAMTW